MNIYNLMNKLKVINEADEYNNQCIFKPEQFDKIKTLNSNFYRDLSPMLNNRFCYCGRWNDAFLIKDWLSLSDINHYDNNKEINERISLRIENWYNFPPNSVPPENSAIFAIEPYSTNETYLVWIEETIEPQIWDYIDGDYNMFHNLERFLEYAVGERQTDDAIRTVWDGKDFSG